ncbi:hypothetical protein [Acidithiobacillus sp.]|jgi:hypothetical protein|uniref:hypothetical protein n=1 Tax=Acidithiobacillus sp. TaxID=1872118 RepID=UPI0025BED963|nr:hypothetical protein [Acidithiobacillus sp.]MCK9188613.1 hypothetical protein [Acidithiobacillus sp.]MCK9360529.1 hypothetical protein [Acidithiobacillus sp.]
MTYQELIEFLDQHLGYPFLQDMAPDAALSAAQQGKLNDALTSEVLTALYLGNQCNAANAPVDRAHSFDGLARLRLRSQADDSDPTIFRKVLKLSQEIDHAFDQELIRQRNENAS